MYLTFGSEVRPDGLMSVTIDMLFHHSFVSYEKTLAIVSESKFMRYTLIMGPI